MPKMPHTGLRFSLPSAWKRTSTDEVIVEQKGVDVKMIMGEMPPFCRNSNRNPDDNMEGNQILKYGNQSHGCVSIQENVGFGIPFLPENHGFPCQKQSPGIYTK